MVFRKNIFAFLILVTLRAATGLVELNSPNNNIVDAEIKLRSTTKGIFTSLDITGVKATPKSKNYSLVHNYLTSLMLRDYYKLMEIAELTKTHKTDNVTNIVDIINEVGLLPEDQDVFTNSINVTDASLNVQNQFDSYVRKLEEYKNILKVNASSVNVKEKLLEYVKATANENREKFNISLIESDSEENDTNYVNASDTWAPSGRRIFKGERTKIKHYPFVASIHEFNMFVCAGAIIKSDLVLTACSCLQLAWNNRFFRENPRYLSVRVGSTFYPIGGESIPALEVYFYPSYDPKTLRNNLAIIRLQRNIYFGKRSRHVKKIEIDRNDNPLPESTPGITIVGWGARDISNKIKDPWSHRISFARLDYYGWAECRDIYSKQYVTKKNFCAGFISHGDGACNKDVGDPGIVGGVLVGVVSFGSPKCGEPDTPTVFTKVGFYSDWIETIMEQEVPKIRKITTTTIEPEATKRTKPTPSTPKPKLKPLRTVDENVLENFIDALFDPNEKDVIFNALRDKANKFTPIDYEAEDNLNVPVTEPLFEITKRTVESDYDEPFLNETTPKTIPTADPEPISPDYNNLENENTNEFLDKHFPSEQDEKPEINYNNLNEHELLINKLKKNVQKSRDIIKTFEKPHNFTNIIEDFTDNIEIVNDNQDYEDLADRENVDVSNETPQIIKDIETVNSIDGIENANVNDIDINNKMSIRQADSFEQDENKNDYDNKDAFFNENDDNVFNGVVTRNFNADDFDTNEDNQEVSYFDRDNVEVTAITNLMYDATEVTDALQYQVVRTTPKFVPVADSIEADINVSDSKKLRDLDEAILTLLYLSDIGNEKDTDAENEGLSIEDVKDLTVNFNNTQGSITEKNYMIL